MAMKNKNGQKIGMILVNGDTFVQGGLPFL